MRSSLLLLFLICSIQVFAQKIAIKNNLAYSATLTPNVAVELSIAKQWTLDTQLAGNFFFHSRDINSKDYKFKKFSFWLLQPELKYWLSKNFDGIYIGLHSHMGVVNIGQYNIPFILQNINDEMKKSRYEASFLGGGLSLGYQITLYKRLCLDISAGLGYAYVWYNKINDITSRPSKELYNADYMGPTKLQIGISYLIK